LFPGNQPMSQEPYKPQESYPQDAYPSHQPPQSNYYSPQDPYGSSPHMYQQAYGQPPANVIKHSSLGIASFSVSVLAGVGLFLLVPAAGVLEATTPGGIDETAPVTIVLGLLMFGCLFLALLAGGLGIGALFQSNCKKLFAVL